VPARPGKQSSTVVGAVDLAMLIDEWDRSPLEAAGKADEIRQTYRESIWFAAPLRERGLPTRLG
jgi:hypothetical protein